MLLLDYCKDWKKYYEIYSNLYTKLNDLLQSYYLPFYNYCKCMNCVESFQEQGLMLPIFQYKSESPYSRLFYEMTTNDTIDCLEDVFTFYDYVKEDYQSVQLLSDMLHSSWFIMNYEYNDDIMMRIKKYYNEYDAIYHRSYLKDIENINEQYQSLIKDGKERLEWKKAQIRQNNDDNNGDDKKDKKISFKSLLQKYEKKEEPKRHIKLNIKI